MKTINILIYIKSQTISNLHPGIVHQIAIMSIFLWKWAIIEMLHNRCSYNLTWFFYLQLIHHFILLRYYTYLITLQPFSFQNINISTYCDLNTRNYQVYFCVTAQTVTNIQQDKLITKINFKHRWDQVLIVIQTS